MSHTLRMILMAWTFLVMPLAGVSLARADAAADMKALAPFLDENTVFVMRIDPAGINTDAAIDLLKRISTDPDAKVDPAGDQRLNAMRAMAKSNLAAWEQAGGGLVYLVFSMSDLMISPQPVILAAVKAEHERAKVNALLENFKMNPGDETRAIHGLIAVGPAKLLDRLAKRQPAARPDMAAAMAAAKDGASLQIVIALTDDTRRVVGEMMPTLPEEIGGGPSTAITEGMRWMNLSINTPPGLSLDLRIKSSDADAAAALRTLMEAGLENVTPEMERELQLKNWKSRKDDLLPRIDGDTLTLSLDQQQAERIAIDVLAPPMRAARKAAMATATMSRMRQLCVAVLIYADSNKNIFPTHLSQLIEKKLLSPAICVRASSQHKLPPDIHEWPVDEQKTWVKENADFILVPNLGKTGEIKDSSKMILVFEKLEQPGPAEISLGYVDGHVERFNAAAFDEVRKTIKDQTGKTLEVWSGLE